MRSYSVWLPGAVLGGMVFWLIVYYGFIQADYEAGDAALLIATSKSKTIKSMFKKVTDLEPGQRQMQVDELSSYLSEQAGRVDAQTDKASQFIFVMSDQYAPPNGVTPRGHFQKQHDLLRARARSTGRFDNTSFPLGFTDSLTAQQKKEEDDRELIFSLSERLAVSDSILAAIEVSDISRVRKFNQLTGGVVARSEKGLGQHVEHVAVRLDIQCSEKALLKLLYTLNYTQTAGRYIGLRGLDITIGNANELGIHVILDLYGAYKRPYGLNNDNRASAPRGRTPRRGSRSRW